MRGWFVLVPVVLFSACTQPRRVAERRIQHRVHRPGWYIDLHGRNTTSRAASQRDATSPSIRSPLLPPCVPRLEATSVPMAATSVPSFLSAPAAQGLPRYTHLSQFAADNTPLAGVAAPPPASPSSGEGGIEPTAMLSLTMALGGLMLLIAALDVLGIVLLSVAVILAIVSLARIARRGTQGRGLAILALVIGLGLVALYLVYLAGGFYSGP